MSVLYILDENQKPLLCENHLKWADWYRDRINNTDWIVGKQVKGDIEVSTVFLAIDHSHVGKKPILYETMVFGADDDHCERYYTKEEALEGHARICKLVFGEE